MSARRVYNDSVRKLVLAFDVGTTYSGVSYSFLDPGQLPSIKGVTKFPAQEHIMGSSKIPTIIYYDQQGHVRAVGAEAVREGIEEDAEDGNWFKAEWFKLHLRTRSPSDKRDIASRIPPLPRNKTIIQVWADFLAYLYQCAASYIKETHANGATLWASLKNRIDFVLSHPNGWEGKEQAQMRKAAVLAGLIDDNKAGHERVSFVTEGEASLHYAIENGVLADAVKGQGVVIVDAGGGTIDISSYTSNSNQATRTFEEIAAPQCHLYGSVFVSMHAQQYLEFFLSDSDFISDLDHIIRCFDRTTKIRFRNPNDPQYIRFGSTRDNDKMHDIRFGQLKVAGNKVAEFFRPSVRCVVDAVKAQMRMSPSNITHVVLVGGFSANDWLFDEIKKSLASQTLTVFRPEHHINKAVSDGAISFYLDHFVRMRISKYTYGSFGNIEYDASEASHRKRQRKAKRFPSGIRVLPDYFTTILPKDTQVSETREFREEYFEEESSLNALREVNSEVWCYKGNLKNPQWKDEDPSNYKLLCTIHANLRQLGVPIETKYRNHQPVYRVHLDLVVMFGLTEVQAQIAWKVGGKEKRSPAKIVYEMD